MTKEITAVSFTEDQRSLLSGALKEAGDYLRFAQAQVLEVLPVGTKVAVRIMHGQVNPTIAEVTGCIIRQSHFGGDPYPVLHIAFWPKRAPRFKSPHMCRREVRLDQVVEVLDHD